MAQGQIKIKLSTVSTIAPSIPTVRHRMFLSDLDLHWIPFNNTQGLFFYKTGSPGEEFCTIVEKLKRSLSLILVDFYPLAGRLDFEGGESGRPEIDCNDNGVEFVEATIDMAFGDVEKDGFQPKSFFKELARTREKSCNAPLLSIQMTAFLGGGICIGMTHHHAIADANSFWYFMKCWGERSRGLPISSKPEHMRTVFKRDDKNCVATPEIYYKGEEVVINGVKGGQVWKFMPEDVLQMNSEPPISEKELINVSTGAVTVENTENNSFQIKSMKDETDLLLSTFHFSEKMIRDLKNRSGASSSFVAVAAHFWRCVMEAREVPENEPVYLVLLADCRGRVKPPLPPTFFGNCVCQGMSQTTAKNLLENDICFVAGLIQEAINSCATEVQLNHYKDWFGSDDHSSFRISLDRLFIVRVVNSPKFPVYDIDYGWGRPMNVQVATMDAVGAMVLFPGRDDRSIDLSTCLPRPHMETLKRIVTVVPH